MTPPIKVMNGQKLISRMLQDDFEDNACTKIWIFRYKHKIIY